MKMSPFQSQSSYLHLILNISNLEYCALIKACVLHIEGNNIDTIYSATILQKATVITGRWRSSHSATPPYLVLQGKQTLS